MSQPGNELENARSRSRSLSPTNSEELEAAGVDREFIEFLRRNIKVFIHTCMTFIKAYIHCICTKLLEQLTQHR